MIKRQQVAVAGAIFDKNNKILFMRRSISDDFLPGVWEIPGGGTEFGEKPEEGLQRELLEECGIKVLVKNPIAVSDYYMEKNGETIQRIEIVFLCELASSNKEVVLSNEHDQYIWEELSKLNNINMTPFMESIIKDIQQAKLALLK